jgi:hypothetical protein
MFAQFGWRQLAIINSLGGPSTIDRANIRSCGGPTCLLIGGVFSDGEARRFVPHSSVDGCSNVNTLRRFPARSRSSAYFCHSLRPRACLRSHGRGIRSPRGPGNVEPVRASVYRTYHGQRDCVLARGNVSRLRQSVLRDQLGGLLHQATVAYRLTRLLRQAGLEFQRVERRDPRKRRELRSCRARSAGKRCVCVAGAAVLCSPRMAPVATRLQTLWWAASLVILLAHPERRVVNDRSSTLRDHADSNKKALIDDRPQGLGLGLGLGLGRPLRERLG